MLVQVSLLGDIGDIAVCVGHHAGDNGGTWVSVLGLLMVSEVSLEPIVVCKR